MVEALQECRNMYKDFTKGGRSIFASAVRHMFERALLATKMQIPTTNYLSRLHDCHVPYIRIRCDISIPQVPSSNVIVVPI